MAHVFGMALVSEHKVRSTYMLLTMLHSLFGGVGKGPSKSAGLVVACGNGITTIKDRKHAVDFIKDPNVEGLVKSKMELTGANRLTVLLGHSHALLEPNASDIDIHPIVCNKIVGVHSGHIRNASDIFSTFQVVREGRYSGEAFFRLLNLLYYRYSNLHTQPMRSAAARVVHTAEGSFLTSWVCKDNPYLLWMASSVSGLIIRYYKTIGLLVFGDDPGCLDKAVQGFELGDYDFIAAEKETLIGIDLHSRTILKKSFSEASVPIND